MHTALVAKIMSDPVALRDRHLRPAGRREWPNRWCPKFRNYYKLPVNADVRFDSDLRSSPPHNSCMDFLPNDEIRKIDAYWRAANYLSVGQIYLTRIRCSPSRSTLEHIKPRLLGHWGTTPGPEFHLRPLNRLSTSTIST